MTDKIAGHLTPEERELYAYLYIDGPATAGEIVTKSGMIGVESTLHQLIRSGLVCIRGTSDGEVYDVSDSNLSPRQLEAAP